MFQTLVTTTEMAKHIDDPNWLIFDARHDLMNPAFGREAYAQGHIPGAQFVSLGDDLAGPKTGTTGRHPLPNRVKIEETFSRLGINHSKQVVVYDQGTTMWVGRLWWMLKWLGHDAVAALDGGFNAWVAEGRATTPEVPTPKPAAFKATPREAWRATVDEVLAALPARSKLVVDARAPERYRGDVEPLDPVGGHIPGAANRPFSQNLIDGKMKPPAVLRAEFEALLAGRAATELVHQCGSGVSACANLLAMEHAGLSGSRLYVGSWSEWCADSARPVAKGPERG